MSLFECFAILTFAFYAIWVVDVWKEQIRRGGRQ